MKNLTYYFLNNYNSKNDKQKENDINKGNLRKKIIQKNINYFDFGQNQNTNINKDFNDKKQNLKRNKSLNYFYYNNSESNNNSENSYIINSKISIHPSHKTTKDNILFNDDKTLSKTPLNFNYSYNYLSNMPKIKKENSSCNLDIIKEVKSNIENLLKKNKYRNSDIIDITKITRVNTNKTDINDLINNNNEDGKKYDIKEKTNYIFYPLNNKNNNNYLNYDIIENKNSKKVKIIY